MPSSTDQLNKILQRARAAQSDSGEDTPEPASTELKTTVRKKAAVGRPRSGKRSDPDYGQTTVWLRRTLIADVDDILRRAPLNDENLGDRSDLIGNLLEEWLKRRQA